MHPRAAIGAPALVMDFGDDDAQRLVCLLASRRRTLPPGVVAAWGNLEHAAHRSHGEMGLLLVDEGEFHSLSFAKKAAAFFKISRSIRSCSTSRRSRSSSARSVAV